MTRINISITDDKAIERLQRLSGKRELSFAALIGQLLKTEDERKAK